MAYYIRVLSDTNDHVSIEEINGLLANEDIKGEAVVDEGTNEIWSQIVLKDSSGAVVSLVERSEVAQGSTAQEELEVFAAEIKAYKPETSVVWLEDFFKKVKVIYAFEIFSPAYETNGWDVIGAVHAGIQDRLNGIFQADSEGFSNREGSHILWQFEDDVDGPWYMAVLNDTGEWTSFEMELSDMEHRKAFLEGRVPEGVKLID